MEPDFRVFYGIGFIIFMGLLFWFAPGMVEPVGWTFALTITGLIQYDEWNIKQETKDIDGEHERL